VLLKGVSTEVGGDVFLTLSEVMERLGVSEVQVRQMVTDGSLKAYRTGNRSLYRAQEVAVLANKVRMSNLMLDEDAFEQEEESSESASLLESLDTTVPGAKAPWMGRMTFFTDQWIRKYSTGRPGRLLSTTILGWIVMVWGGVGVVLGIHRIQAAALLTNGKETTLAVAGLYMMVKIFLTGVGAFTLLRSRRAFGLAMATMFLAILESALYMTVIKHAATKTAVWTILLVTVVYLAVVLYLASRRVLRECGHG